MIALELTETTSTFFKYSIRGAEVTAYHIYWYWHVLADDATNIEEYKESAWGS